MDEDEKKDNVLFMVLPDKINNITCFIEFENITFEVTKFPVTGLVKDYIHFEDREKRYAHVPTGIKIPAYYWKPLKEFLDKMIELNKLNDDYRDKKCQDRS